MFERETNIEVIKLFSATLQCSINYRLLIHNYNLNRTEGSLSIALRPPVFWYRRRIKFYELIGQTLHLRNNLKCSVGYVEESDIWNISFPSHISERNSVAAAACKMLIRTKRAKHSPNTFQKVKPVRVKPVRRDQRLSPGRRTRVWLARKQPLIAPIKTTLLFSPSSGS